MSKVDFHNEVWLNKLNSDVWRHPEGDVFFHSKKLKKVQCKGMEHKDIEMFRLNHI